MFKFRKLVGVLVLSLVGFTVNADLIYTSSEVSSSLRNISGTGTVLGASDDSSHNINLGFNFDYFDTSFSSVNVTSNGILSFISSSSFCCSGVDLTTSSSPYDYFVSVLHDDLYPGNLRYQFFGTAGNMELTIGWYNFSYFGNRSASNTFEVTLFESTNNILFNYENVTSYAGNWAAAAIRGNGTETAIQNFFQSGNQSIISNRAFLMTAATAIENEPLAEASAPGVIGIMLIAFVGVIGRRRLTKQ